MKKKNLVFKMLAIMALVVTMALPLEVLKDESQMQLIMKDGKIYKNTL